MPCRTALPSLRWARVESACAVTSNLNGWLHARAAASHSTVPAIVSAN